MKIIIFFILATGLFEVNLNRERVDDEVWIRYLEIKSSKRFLEAKDYSLYRNRLGRQSLTSKQQIK